MANSKKTAIKKVAAKKTPAKKTMAPKLPTNKTATSKKPAATKTSPNTPAIKKGSKLACKVCGFAITVDNISGNVEEALLICCDTAMHHKTAAKKK